jgi:hypothetical protein
MDLMMKRGINTPAICPCSYTSLTDYPETLKHTEKNLIACP